MRSRRSTTLASASREIALDDYFRGHSRFQSRRRARSTAFRGTSTRDVLYYRRDLLQQAGFDAPPRTWDEWTQMLGAIKALVGSERYSILLPLNEF